MHLPSLVNSIPFPPHFFIKNLDILLPTITNIISTSLTTGIVPRDLKTAIVKPLLKKPSLYKNLLKNYHPISNLSCLSKILEKVVLHKLLSHLQENNLSNPFQSAYRAGHSTTLITSYILSQLDYCNCLLMGTPNSVIQPLQKIQNFAARLVLLAPRHHHSNTSPGKTALASHSEHIKYKVACMCFNAINGSGPAYHLNSYMSTLRLSWKSSDTNTRVMAFMLSLALDPTFGIHSHKTLDTAQPCHLLTPNWKPSSSHQLISIPSFCYNHCVCACACVSLGKLFW